MWYRLFYTLGRLARLVVEARRRGLLPRRRRVPGAAVARRGAEVSRLLEELLDLDDRRLCRAALAGALETGQALLNRPSVRASLEGALLRLLGRTSAEPRPTESARRTAELVAAALRQRGILPSRVAVDGLPGSGKSTLARALAERLGLAWRSLDHEDLNTPRDFTRGRTIYEHHRLLRTQDADVFDVIVYVDEPPETSKARVLQRARSEARESLIIDVLDYDKLKNIGRLAFDVCEADPIPIPGSALLMKVRPPAGFRAGENLARRLRAAGHDVAGLGKEEMLFLLLYGRARRGLMAYLLPGAYTEELFLGLLAGMQEYLAG